jgi:hypothetical protein
MAAAAAGFGQNIIETPYPAMGKKVALDQSNADTVSESPSNIEQVRHLSPHVQHQSMVAAQSAPGVDIAHTISQLFISNHSEVSRTEMPTKKWGYISGRHEVPNTTKLYGWDNKGVRHSRERDQSGFVSTGTSNAISSISHAIPYEEFSWAKTVSDCPKYLFHSH